MAKNHTTVAEIDDTDLHASGASATYCPEDDKIRLYVGRVERSTYNFLRANKFVATPKQSCDFVAVWSPNAEDITFQLIPEDADIEDEDYSPEERASDRAERFAGYRDKRRTEAGGHADTYDNGPSVFGNQNGARAQRQADRHERHRDRALCQWSKAEYWQTRTAAVIGHALHRSTASVRRGRILTLEKELRDCEKSNTAWIERYDFWKSIAESTEEGVNELLPLGDDGYAFTQKMTPIQIKAYMRASDGRCSIALPREEEEANAKYMEVHPYSGRPGFSAYDLMTDETFIRVPVRRLTPKEVAEKYIAASLDPRSEAADQTGTRRNIKHLTMRLIYENAMLENEGGQASAVEMVVGGWIGKRQIWKINRSPVTGRVVSVAFSATGWPRNIERLGADIYRAPTAEDLAAMGEAKTKAAKTLGLINPTEDDARKLQALWNSKVTPMGGSRSINSHGTVELTTQARYTHGAKCSDWTYTTTLFEDGSAATYRGTVQEWTAAGKKVVGKLRINPSLYGVNSIVVLTDKPQKALPVIWLVPANTVTPEPEQIIEQEEAPEPEPVVCDESTHRETVAAGCLF